MLGFDLDLDVDRRQLRHQVEEDVWEVELLHAVMGLAQDAAGSYLEDEKIVLVGRCVENVG